MEIRPDRHWYTILTFLHDLLNTLTPTGLRRTEPELYLLLFTIRQLSILDKLVFLQQRLHHDLDTLKCEPSARTHMRGVESPGDKFV